MAKDRSVGSSFVGRNIHILSPLILLLSALIATIIVAACGAQSSSPSGNTTTTNPQQEIPKITIKAMDFSFAQPQTVPAGLVDLTFVNNGAQPHMIQIARINNGNFSDFQATLNKDPNSPVNTAKFFGGVNTIDPGQKQEVILNLQQGEYATICFFAGSDNVPHYMKGMINHFTVTGSSSGSQGQPQSDGDVVLKDYTFVLPSDIPAGPATLKITNQGPSQHEMDLVKLAQGKSLQDLKNYLNSTNPNIPPPADFVGGMGALAPGNSGWLKLNLQPGNYATLCFVPDAKTGKPHYMFGMMTQFTVK